MKILGGIKCHFEMLFTAFVVHHQTIVLCIGSVNIIFLTFYVIYRNALKMYSRARDYCTSAKHIVILCLNIIRVSYTLIASSLSHYFLFYFLR